MIINIWITRAINVMDKAKPDLKKTERLAQNTQEYVKRY